MILACEQCQTRFQLDERRIPSGGARVRCSKCNHAFFVRPPEVVAETTLEGVVAGTVEEAIPAPEPEPTAGGLGRMADTDPGLSDAMEAFDEVPPDEWTFGDESPDPRAVSPSGGGAPAADVDSPFGEAGDLGQPDPLEAMAREVAAEPQGVAGQEELDLDANPDAPDPSSAGLDGLGNPADWDFLEDSVPAPPPEAMAEVEAASPPAVEPKPKKRRFSGPSLRLQAWTRQALAGLGWLLCVGLILVGLGQTLRTALEPGVIAPVLQPAAGGPEVRDLTVRSLENLHSGPILVVAGVLAARRGGPAGLQVQLLGASGEPLEGATAWAGPALAERALRELDPAGLQLTQRSGTPDLIHGGAFHAVFDPIPRGAQGIALRAAAPPAPSVPGPTEAAGDPEEEGPRAPSPPPSPLPSRE